MTVYKIYAEHEDKMVESFMRGFMPKYTKYGMLYYSENIANKNLDKCNEFKNSNERYNHYNFVLKTFEMVEI